MPNWCTNRLTVFGPEQAVRDFYWAAKGETQHYAPSKFDIAYRGDKAHEIDRTIYDFSFHALVPIPDEIMAGQYDPDGYNAERQLWGCKWGPTHSEIVSENFKDEVAEVTYTFQTPWGIGTNFFETVSLMYPGLTFVISFAEEYPTRGRYVYRRGEFTEPKDDGSFGKYPRPDYPDGEEYDQAVEDAFYEKYDLWYNAYLETHDQWIENNKAAYAEEENRHAHPNAP